ncbi:hypothetical protein H0H92_013091 [Tricholoma furcatifolium]|nr:hypothetical protein H0H92_013091 [Tricholoma furcatifolium]
MDELPEPTPVPITAAPQRAPRKVPKFYKTKKIGKFPAKPQEESYDNMSSETKAEYKRAAQEAIDQFLKYPNTTTIDHRLRKLIRENQEFMPHVANKTRRLALELLTSNRNNIICHYHHMHEKGGEVVDGEGKYMLNGVPFPRKVNQTKSDRIERPEGHLHCGCKEDVALMDFYFWKTWSLSGELSNGTEVTELLKDQMLEPRVRAFVVEQFEHWTGLTVNDIYHGKQTRTEHRMDIYHRQIEYLIKRLNKLAKDDGDRYYLAVEDLE